MIGIIVTGHGHFASGIQSAVGVITGEERQMAYVDFTESMSADDLNSELCKAVDRVDSGEGVLFLTDIPGGSPFQQSATVATRLKLADVVCGTNLIMATEACMAREFTDFRPLVNKTISKGRDNINSIYCQ